MNRLLTIIPARAGSKGLPGKNTNLLVGKPLIHYTLEALREANLESDIVLSTDSDLLIKQCEIYPELNVDKRSPELAGDEASIVDVIRDLLGKYPHHDQILLLQPTSPLRSSIDINESYRMFKESGAFSCVSLVEAKSVKWMFGITGDNSIVPHLNFEQQNRQALKGNYLLNGAIYFVSKDFFTKHNGFIGSETRGYIMPRERSVDIDDQLDWDLAEFFLERKK